MARAVREACTATPVLKGSEARKRVQQNLRRIWNIKFLKFIFTRSEAGLVSCLLADCSPKLLNGPIASEPYPVADRLFTGHKPTKHRLSSCFSFYHTLIELYYFRR